jgi:NTP pyrophosphatase (non-canonical NTP hydrolase)
MTESEKQILLICQEECAEVTQAISKVFRFGYDSVYPKGSSEDNRAKLEGELGDLQAMIELMIETGIVDGDNVKLASTRKKIKLKEWSNIYDEVA